MGCARRARPPPPRRGSSPRRPRCRARGTVPSPGPCRPLSRIPPALGKGEACRGLYPDRVPPLTVGFDLDMTLIDSRPGIAATYDALAAETGRGIDSAAPATRLG